MPSVGILEIITDGVCVAFNLKYAKTSDINQNKTQGPL
jgi:hypothetical protein